MRTEGKVALQSGSKSALREKCRLIRNRQLLLVISIVSCEIPVQYGTRPKRPRVVHRIVVAIDRGHVPLRGCLWPIDQLVVPGKTSKGLIVASKRLVDADLTQVLVRLHPLRRERDVKAGIDRIRVSLGK